MKECLRCKGTGEYKSFTGKITTCDYCEGKGYLPSPLEEQELREIIERITINRKGKLSLRKSAPNNVRDRIGYKESRIYAVWRLARFHGGLDVTMPMCAMTDIYYDPYQDEIDAIASKVAQIFCGTDMAAACRWGQLFGWAKDVPAGLPITAYEGSPPVITEKPIDEWLETF